MHLEEENKVSGERTRIADGNHQPDLAGVDSLYAWTRLSVALLISTIGGVGMWSVVVVLPVVQAEFGVARADATLPYTMTMIGFGIGGVVMGKLADRFGIVLPVLVGAIMLSLGYVLSASSTSILQFGLVPCTGCADRLRYVDHVRTVVGRYVFVVHEASRCGRWLDCQWQLSGGRSVAPNYPALRADIGLAGSTSGNRIVLSGNDAAIGVAISAQACTGRGTCGSNCVRWIVALAPAWSGSGNAAIVAGDCRCQLLCRDGHASGPSGRLL